MYKPKVTIIIPAFNEEKNIGFVMQDTEKLRKIYTLQVIVVDDCSYDRTYQIAKKSGADLVIKHKVNSGKGYAFKSGLKSATGDYVVQIDADGQLKAADIPKLITELINGADMVLGERYDFKSFLNSSFTSNFKMIGNLILSIASSLAVSMVIFDVMTGLKALRRDKAVKIIPKSKDFSYEAELVIRAAKKRFHIKTVSISCRKRYSGSSNLQSIKHGLSVLQTIIRTSFGK